MNSIAQNKKLLGLHHKRGFVMKSVAFHSPAKSDIAALVLVGLLLAPSISFGVALDTVNWAASSTNNGMGTGQLDGITVNYQSVAGFNSGETLTENWPSYQGTSAATAVTFQTGGVLGGGTNGTAETISFSAPVVDPILLVNFLGGLGHTFDGDFFNFGGHSFTVLSAFNATQSGNTMAATTAVTDTADDGYAIKFDGTFGPGNPLSFTYTSDGMGQNGLQTVGFTIGTASIPDSGESVLLFGLGLAAVALYRRSPLLGKDSQG